MSPNIDTFNKLGSDHNSEYIDYLYSKCIDHSYFSIKSCNKNIINNFLKKYKPTKEMLNYALENVQNIYVIKRILGYKLSLDVSCVQAVL